MFSASLPKEATTGLENSNATENLQLGPRLLRMSRLKSAKDNLVIVAGRQSARLRNSARGPA